MTDYLKSKVEYIRNTAQNPLAISAFDEDWEPAGPEIRRQLRQANLIQELAGGRGIILTGKGKKLIGA